MTTANLERAVAINSGLMAKLTPDQLDAATPCASWKVRDIINHLVGATYFFTAVATTGSPPAAEDEQDFAAGDYKAAYAAGSAQVLAAFNAEGAMEKTMDFGFAKVPGTAALGLVMTDTFTHAWDLARAMGEPTDLEPAIAAELLKNARLSIPEAFRGEDGKAAFGPIVDVPSSAPAADQLAGFLGRQV